jgi:hypothetical protein
MDDMASDSTYHSSEYISLRSYVERLIDERDSQYRTLIDERDRQYDSKFKAAELAVQVGLVAQKTATDAALTAQKTATDAAFAASEKAITKAEASTEKRFEGVNEFRKTLDDAQRILIPRNEALALIGNQNTKIDAADKQIGLIQVQLSGSVTQSQYQELQKQVNDLRESRSLFQGQTGQKDAGTISDRWATGIAVAAVGLILTIVEVALRLSGH